MNVFDVGLGRGTAIVLALAIGSGLVLFTESPPRGRVVVTDTETEILDVVEFAPGTDTLRPTSSRTLAAVAATLRGNPSIELVEVQSHTSGVGDDTANLTLSERRAAVIVRYLVDAGIDSSRLIPQGCGDTQPIDRATPAKNERVAFLILRRSTDRDAHLDPQE
jgi:outer membrane protein OmpA-like peptidoglycan-associated protein